MDLSVPSGFHGRLNFDFLSNFNGNVNLSVPSGFMDRIDFDIPSNFNGNLNVSVPFDFNGYIIINHNLYFYFQNGQVINVSHGPAENQTSSKPISSPLPPINFLTQPVNQKS
jgi:hypothetical protein